MERDTLSRLSTSNEAAEEAVELIVNSRGGRNGTTLASISTNQNTLQGDQVRKTSLR